MIINWKLFIEGGGSVDPKLNSALKRAIDEALKRDVPKTAIQKVLKQLSENKAPAHRHLFEARLYRKVHAIIAVNTNNVPLTKNQIAYPFKKVGSFFLKYFFIRISYCLIRLVLCTSQHNVEQVNTKRSFVERGVFNVIARAEINIDKIEDECLSDAIECGAEDIEVDDASKQQVTFFCNPLEFLKVKQKLTAIGHKVEHAECIFYPKISLVQLTESELADYDKFKDKLVLVDGLDEIYDNVENGVDEWTYIFGVYFFYISNNSCNIV